MLPEEVLRRCVIGKLVFRPKRQLYAGVVSPLLAEKRLPCHTNVEVAPPRDMHTYTTYNIAIPIQEHRRYFFSKMVYPSNVIIVRFSVHLYSPEIQRWQRYELYLGECGIYENGYHTIHYDDLKHQNRMSSFYDRMQLPVIT